MTEFDEEEREQLLDARRAELKETLERATRGVMQTPEGRRFVWWLLSAPCGVFNPSWTGEAMGGAYKEGARGVGIHLMGELQRLCPESYLEMVRDGLSVPQPGEGP